MIKQDMSNKNMFFCTGCNKTWEMAGAMANPSRGSASYILRFLTDNHFCNDYPCPICGEGNYHKSDCPNIGRRI